MHVITRPKVDKFMATHFPSGTFTRLPADICKLFFPAEDPDALELLPAEDFFSLDELVFSEDLLFPEFEGFLFCSSGLSSSNLPRLS